MLKHLNFHDDAKKLESAVLGVLKDGKVRTEDMGGKSTTSDMVSSIMSKLK